MFFNENNLWFAPVNVLYHYSRLDLLLPNKQKQTRSFRKAKEAFYTAVALMGIIKYQKRHYWLQTVDDAQGSPDIRSGTFIITPDKPKEFTTQDVEFVEFGSRSEEDIVTFLLKKKLNKNYPVDTTILCHVSKTIQLPPYKDIAKGLHLSKSNCPVILLGKIYQNKEVYRICQVHPTIDLLIDFDVIEESYNKKWRGVLKLSRGTNDKLNFIYLPNEKHYPFESFGFIAK